MTAPAATIASFVQPAARLAMGDSAGAALGGFEALLAMLTQSLQGAGQATTGETAPETTTDAPAETGDLAALLGQTGAATWLTQAMSQAAPAAEDAEAPILCATPQAKGPMVDLASVVPQAANPAAMETTPTSTVATETAAPAPISDQPDTTALDALLRSQAPEAVDPAILEQIKPVKGQTAAQSLQSLLPTNPAPAATAPTRPAAETAAVVAQVQAAVQLPTDDQTRTIAETVPAPAVIVPPAETRPAITPRKAAPVGDAKVAKVQSADASPAPTAIVAAEDSAETAVEDLAPAPVAAREAEAAETPAHAPETVLQTLTARLESVAAGAAALAAQVRGAPETVAKLAAGILDKLNGQSTKFDLQLDPHGLGKVDVSVEIGADGKLTAQMGFDSAVGLSELRGRAQELRTALEQAGFSLAEGALSFDFSGERRQQQAANGETSRTDQAGKAFARALGALDDELAAAPTRYQARQGLDLLI